MNWTGCGAFEVRMGDVNFAFDPYLFGGNLANAEPIFDYIFISHEHFDHCHPKTLQALCQGDRFQKLFVNPGCLDPARPIAERYGDAAFERDLPITKHISEEKVQVIYPRHLDDNQGVDRTFPGPFEMDLGPLHVVAIESGENQGPELPTCGYLITHKEKGVSFFHTGDLHRTYEGLQKIRGQVDYLIHMKTGLTEWEGPDKTTELLCLVDFVQPRFLIPTHYRTDRISDPIPEGHWPPNATDVAGLIEWIREQVGDRTQVLPLTAGVDYEVELPTKKVIWKWNWLKTWTVPPWRDE
jgi:L-ascorbate metabolism protein UlaG (beta-lactamase superfamily)